MKIHKALIFMLFQMAVPLVFGAEYFASPNGSPTGTGAKDKPLDIVTALDGRKSPVRPGDTLWLRQGIYVADWGGFISTLAGEPSKPIIVRNYQSERATIDGQFALRGNDTWLWGLEITTLSAPPPATLTRQKQWELILNGTYRKSNLMLESSPRSKVINCVVHRNYREIQSSTTFSDTDFYGNIVAGNGSSSADYADGHGMYVQNQTGIKRIMDNIVVNNYLEGIHAYSMGAIGVNNLKVEGNIIFGNGMKGTPGGRNILVGTEQNMVGLEIRNNFLYTSPSVSRPNILIGYSGVPVDPLVRGNWCFHGGISIKNAVSMDILDNTFVGRGDFQIISPKNAALDLDYKADGNRYFQIAFNPSYYDANGVYREVHTAPDLTGFAFWRNTFGYDLNGRFDNNLPTGSAVIVRPNRYEAGRANVGAFNPMRSASLSMDPSSFLPVNTKYEIRNGENFYGPALASGVYSGGTISLPMGGLEVRAFVVLPLGLAQPPEPPAGNTAPYISVIPNMTTQQGVPTAPFNFVVSDAETPADRLGVLASSSNQALAPNSNIILGGGGSSRSVVIAPAAGQYGTATIRITAHDGTLVSTRTFTLTVNAIATSKPVITLEAESAQLASPMAVFSASLASQGKYIATSVSESGLAAFNVDIPTADGYVVWCRVASPASNQDSFYVSVNGAGEEIFDTCPDYRYSEEWRWVLLNGRASGQNPRVLSLGAGRHQILFRGRDNPTKLDKIIVTSNRTFVPVN